jgi:glycosyltransferase involved in cell wall biosynthesis
MLFSIITVNRNDAEGLRSTIESVKRFAPADHEYIVIDGASTDESVRVIKEESGAIDTWVSEKDSGIYEAMNKGIHRAKGVFCLFLNSGDCLCRDNGLASFIDTGKDIYYADAVLVTSGGRTVLEYPRTLDVNFFVSGMINHQNALVRRELFEKIGPYDEDLSISSDWLFFLKAAYLVKASFQYIGRPIVEFSAGGISTKPGSGAIISNERKKGLVKVFGELAPTMLELVELRESIYGNTIRLFGKTRTLDFVIRAYRFFARRLAACAHKDQSL